MTDYKCPFCDVKLDKNEMRYHVGIPLCMDIRIQTTPTEKLPTAIPELETPVSTLYLEYFGEENIKCLLSLQFERMTFMHPDRGKPIELEKFRKGQNISPCAVCRGDVTIQEIMETLTEKRDYQLCERHQDALAFAWASETIEIFQKSVGK